MPSDSYVSDLNAVWSLFLGTQPLENPKLKKPAKSVALPSIFYQRNPINAHRSERPTLGLNECTGQNVRSVCEGGVESLSACKVLPS